MYRKDELSYNSFNHSLPFRIIILLPLFTVDRSSNVNSDSSSNEDDGQLMTTIKLLLSNITIKDIKKSSWISIGGAASSFEFTLPLDMILVPEELTSSPSSPYYVLPVGVIILCLIYLQRLTTRNTGTPSEWPGLEQCWLMLRFTCNNSSYMISWVPLTLWARFQSEIGSGD